MNRLDSLFSPGRLNRKWASPEADISEEDSANESTIDSANLLQQWDICRQNFSNDFRSDKACVQIIDNIETQLTDMSQNSPAATEKMNRLTHNILLLERLCETQIITQQRSQRKQY